jgi:hypothetical protein
MKLLSKKQAKKPNVLELSDPERVILVKAAREQLKQTITEARLWQSLLAVENLAVNGNMIVNEKRQPGVFRLENVI